MLLASLPIEVVMHRSPARHRWADTAWLAASVRLPEPQAWPAGMLPNGTEESGVDGLNEKVGQLQLELHPDENDGYFENWAAPQPKVFVMWQMREALAVPVAATVSYAEGTRMLDSGDNADGLPMPPAVHAWLAAYLRIHYRPQQSRKGPRRG
jgi:hypothetical protein